jgi:hypothetical protein
LSRFHAVSACRSLGMRARPSPECWRMVRCHLGPGEDCERQQDQATIIYLVQENRVTFDLFLLVSVTVAVARALSKKRVPMFGKRPRPTWAARTARTNGRRPPTCD